MPIRQQRRNGEIPLHECVSHAFPLNLKISLRRSRFSSFSSSLGALRRVNDEKHLQEENHRVDEREHSARYEHVHVLFARVVFVVVVVRAENLPPIIDNYGPSHDVQQRADRREHYQLQSERIDVTWRRIEDPCDPLLLAFFFARVNTFGLDNYSVLPELSKRNSGLNRFSVFNSCRINFVSAVFDFVHYFISTLFIPAFTIKES